MKKLFNLFAFCVVAAVLATPMFAQAVDTLTVAALPAGNINAVINGDTLVGGLRAHPNRVYKLRRGSVYQVTEALKINGSITIVSNDTIAGVRPPVLAPSILSDNSSVDHFIDLNGKGSKVFIRDVYLLSIRSDGAKLGWSAGIRINADSVYMKLRNVVFDSFTEAGVRQYASWDKLDIQDCHFRNFIHGSSYFGGQPIMSDQPNHMDTCRVINNTFFACNSYLWSIRGYDRYSVFEHNSVIYGVVNPFLTRQGSNLHIKNNVFYASHAYGGIPDHVINGWFLNYPDTTASSIINIRTKGTYKGITVAGTEAYLDSAKGVFAGVLLDSKRTHEIRNNAYFFPTKLTDFYKAYNDTVKTGDTVAFATAGQGYLIRKLILPRWMTDYTLFSIDSVLNKVAKATTTISGNTNTDPVFSTAMNGHVDALIDYIKKIATNKLDTGWYYKAQYPPTWPIPENLAYTNATMQAAGTDGFAQGDLNWFPTQKAKYLLTDVAVTTLSTLPGKFELVQNYPNPFNPSTTVNFSVKTTGMTTLKVYNIIGQEVATLVNDVIVAGSHQVVFNASRLSSGVYFYTLRSGGFVETKKMSLLK